MKGFEAVPLLNAIAHSNGVGNGPLSMMQVNGCALLQPARERSGSRKSKGAEESPQPLATPTNN
jgi:hypothetical protein